MTFNLDALDTRTRANEGVEVDIVNPRTGDSTGLFIRILGQDSDTYAKLREKQEKRAARAMSQGRSVAQITDKSMDANKDNPMEVVVACTIGYRLADGNKLVSDGVEIDLGRDKAATEDFYTKYPEVRRQVLGAIADASLFIKASSPT